MSPSLDRLRDDGRGAICRHRLAPVRIIRNVAAESRRGPSWQCQPIGTVTFHPFSNTSPYLPFGALQPAASPMTKPRFASSACAAAVRVANAVRSRDRVPTRRFRRGDRAAAARSSRHARSSRGAPSRPSRSILPCRGLRASDRIAPSGFGGCDRVGAAADPGGQRHPQTPSARGCAAETSPV